MRHTAQWLVLRGATEGQGTGVARGSGQKKKRLFTSHLTQDQVMY